MHARLRLFRRQDSAFGRRADFLLKSYPPIAGIARERDVTKTTSPGLPADALQAAADRLLLQVYAPAAVVLNRDADIVYISGRTGKYLEPAAGKANWNIHAMARDDLRQPLARAIKQAADSDTPIKLHDVEVRGENGAHRIDVTVQAISEPASLRGLTMVVFSDIEQREPTAAPSKRKATQASKADAQPHLAEIQALREEARSYREEAQAAQEELQSTNEELQSANEELTTSKEEMQSMNEELQTINSELQSKLDDLLLAQSDMQNILNSVEIAILFLDKELNVRRFTDRAAGIISLRESDVGRPLSDLTNRLEYPQLQNDALETLRKLKPREKQIQSSDKRWFDLRIIPYRRLDDVIDGVVITLVDITEAKQLEQSLRDHED
jgi:two-component system, chemotaxis family, CheB/CheR fusion protein